MQVLINIDENLYTRLFDNGEIDAADMNEACASIRNGEPLIGDVIPLEKVRQAKEKIDDLDRFYDNDYFTSDGSPMFKSKDVLGILIKLIESEEK